MNEIETLKIIRQNIKTKHMVKDMFDGSTKEERDAYRQQFSAMTNAIEAICEKREREKGCNACHGSFADENVSERYCAHCGQKLEVEKDG